MHLPRHLRSSFARLTSLALLVSVPLVAAGCEEFTGTGAGGAASSTSSSTTEASTSSSSTSGTSTTVSSSSGASCPGGCPAGANATGACVNGSCVYTCMPDFGDCDANPTTCETSLTTDTDCGACDATCATHCAAIDGMSQCNDATAIAAGAAHTCAVRRDGTVWCWGFNNFGQVGIGSNLAFQFIPAHITLPFKAKRIAARYNATCALGEGGEVACWGRDGNDFFTPLVYSQFAATSGIDVAGLDPSDNGPGTSIFLDATTGAARTFVVSNMSEPGTNLVLAAQAEVAAGGGHYCVRNLAGEVRCAGANGKSQLGIAPTSFETQLKLVPVTAKSIALGARHSCAIGTDDALRCWGDNAASQTGLMGATVVQPSLVSIPGGAAVESIALGETNTAAIAGGSLYLWGGNTDHQSSQTADNPVLTPTAYPLANVVAVAVGTSHTCALTSAGKMLCWGANGGYQLGTGTTTPSTTPVEVVFP